MTTRKTKTTRTMNYDAKAGVLTIKEGNKHDVYFVEEIYTAPGYGAGRGFEMRKHIRTADMGHYHVFAAVNPEASTCDCRGFERHGNCRHTAALVKLIELGMIPDPRENDEADCGPTEVAEQPAPAWRFAEQDVF